MRIYQIIILTTVVLRYLLLFFEWRTVQKIKTVLPDEVHDVCSADQFRRSQEYTRTKTSFQLLQATFGLALLLIFWFSGGFNWIDEIVRSWNLSPIVTGIVYIGILTIANLIISLPFDLYSTFVIEERYGFNRTSPATFISDRIKAVGLMVLIGTPALAAILWFFQTFGSSAWIYCWIFAVLFSLALQFLAPVWILPLFNKFSPLPDGTLKDELFQLAERLHFPVREISIVDSSKRSSKTNAFFTGFGKNKRIALFDTLVAESSVPEVVAVLAHEIGHYKKKHILKSTIISIFHTGIVFFILSLFPQKEALFQAFYVEKTSNYIGLILFGLLYEPVSFLLSIALNAFSRKNEFEADRYGVENVPDREALVSALKKLYATNLSNLTPHPFYVFLNYSHPPLVDRIKAIRSEA